MKLSLAATVLISAVWAFPAAIPPPVALLTVSSVEIAASSALPEPKADTDAKSDQNNENTKAAAEETAQAQASGPGDSKKLPDELTLATFDEFTASHVTFLEFYLPYCSHCKQLAPKWKKTFETLQKEQPDLPIHMRQVNCVESGDLCEREGISYYPNLRLYVPSKDAAKGKFVELYPRAMDRTPESFMRYMVRSVAEYNSGAIDLPSASVEGTAALGLNMSAGEIDEPYFVALFAASSAEWAKDSFLDSCIDCLEHKQTWSKVSNLVLGDARTVHFNCFSQAGICTKLGYPELTRPDATHSPRYAMFLPRAAGLVRLDYRGEPTSAEMLRFATKVSTSGRFEHVSRSDLASAGFLSKSIDNSKNGDRVVVVFAYEAEAVLAEDKAVLPYILESVARSPFDVTLYVSSEDFSDALKAQAKGLLEYVAQDESFKVPEFDAKLHYATMSSALPTLYIFKENLLVPAVYQNYALEDMRDEKKIAKFIEKYSHPLCGPLTPELVRAYFNRKGRKNALRDDRVVVTFVNLADQKEMSALLQKVSLLAHEYSLLRKQYYYLQILSRRSEKKVHVDKMKQEKAKTADIVGAMRERVPHLFEDDDVVFAYVDLAEYPQFAMEAGWDVDGRNYVPGDAVVVSKTNKYYWDQNLQGAPLKMVPSSVRPVLEYLIDPKLVLEKPTGFSAKLSNSPYPSFLRYFDFVHQHGFFGYLVFFLIVFAVYKVVTRRRLHRGIISMVKSD